MDSIKKGEYQTGYAGLYWCQAGTLSEDVFFKILGTCFARSATISLIDQKKGRHLPTIPWRYSGAYLFRPQEPGGPWACLFW